jgi:prevent-host-death family protein
MVESPNHKGAVAEAAIAYEAVRLGVAVFKPLSEHSRSDLIFEIAGSVYRVQCKTARRKGEVIVISLGTARCTPFGYVRARYGVDEIDLIAAHCHELERNYLLPFNGKVGSQKAIQLRLSAPQNGQRASINYASSYEFRGAVAQLGERRHGMAEVRGSSPLSSTQSRSDGEVVVGAHELRDHFGYYMERAELGEDILVTRRGKPVARLIGLAGDSPAQAVCSTSSAGTSPHRVSSR